MSLDDPKPWRAPLQNRWPKKRPGRSGTRGPGKTHAREGDVLRALGAMGEGTARGLAMWIGNIDESTVNNALAVLEKRELVERRETERALVDRKSCRFIWRTVEQPCPR